MMGFPNGAEEKSLIRFIASFEYLNEKDTKFFFSTENYYKKRLKSLVEKRYLRKIGENYVLGDVGIAYVKSCEWKYISLTRNKRYIPRLLFISHLAAFYKKCKNIDFIPSKDLKDREVFTTTSRKFVGIIEIDGIQYFAYHISEENEKAYISAVAYDIQKEQNIRNTILFINDLNRIRLDDFAFGNNQVLVMKDTVENEEKLKYLNRVKWSKIIKKYYNNKVFLSGYSFCDYTDYKSIYVSVFNFIDTEKINRIKQFLRENNNKKADIICSPEIEIILRKEIPEAKFVVVDLEQYTDKEKRYYD